MTDVLLERDDRRKRLGGSEIAAVVGLDKRRTRYMLWCAKTAQEPKPIDPELARFFRRRTRQEPVIAEMLRDEGLNVTRVSYGNPNRYADLEHPWMSCEIDYEFTMTQAARERMPRLAHIPDGETVNGEMKTHYAFLGARFYGDEEAEEVPAEYACQVQWGLGITGRRAAVITPLFGVDNLELYPILRDDEAIGFLRAEAVKFWTENVLGNVAPDPQSTEDVLHMTRGYRGRPVELDEEAVDAARRIVTLRAANRANEAQIKEYEFRLFDYVRQRWGFPAAPGPEALSSEDVVFTFAGRPLFRWNEEPRVLLDQKRLKDERPDIAREFSKQIAPRVLRAIKLKTGGKR